MRPVPLGVPISIIICCPPPPRPASVRDKSFYCFLAISRLGLHTNKLDLLASGSVSFSYLTCLVTVKWFSVIWWFKQWTRVLSKTPCQPHPLNKPEFQPQLPVPTWVTLAKFSAFTSFICSIFFLMHYPSKITIQSNQNNEVIPRPHIPQLFHYQARTGLGRKRKMFIKLTWKTCLSVSQWRNATEVHRTCKSF